MKNLRYIEICGFKSIQDINLELRPLNVLIGANGSGKSNFIEVFTLLNYMVEKRLQLFVAERGGADNLLFFGQKETKEIKIEVSFGDNKYSCNLTPTQENKLIFAEEQCLFKTPEYSRPHRVLMKAGHSETRLHDEARKQRVARFVLDCLKSWIVYHFHDTSTSAKVRKECDINDNAFLRSDASNLAAFLYFLRKKHTLSYKNIVDTVKLVAPFFDDFLLEPSRLNPENIRLQWRHAGSTRYFNGHALSDGTMRFICIATVLLQPNLPSVVLLDEPELGLHPYAISLLAEMLRSAATKTQVIVSTQSATFVNQFEPEDVIVAERKDRQSVFRRLSRDEMKDWLEDYGLGDLWEKNVFGGRP